MRRKIQYRKSLITTDHCATWFSIVAQWSDWRNCCRPFRFGTEVISRAILSYGEKTRVCHRKKVVFIARSIAENKQALRRGTTVTDARNSFPKIGKNALEIPGHMGENAKRRTRR
jgi:hypothetical protein